MRNDGVRLENDFSDEDVFISQAVTARSNREAHFDFSSSPRITTFSAHTQSVKGLILGRISASLFPSLFRLCLRFHSSWLQVNPVLLEILPIHPVKDIIFYLSVT